MPDLTKKTTIRKGVMIPCFAFMAFIIVLGIFKNDWLKTICKSAFRFSLINFGWAYQLVAMASLVCVAVVTFSKIGSSVLHRRVRKHIVLRWAVAFTTGRLFPMRFTALQVF